MIQNFLYCARLALQVPSIFTVASKASANLYFFLFIILGVISSIIVRNNIIDFTLIISPIHTFLFSLLLLFTFAYIIYLEICILFRIINGIKYHSHLLFSNQQSLKILFIYYSLSLLGIGFSLYILSVLYSLPVLSVFMRQLLFTGLLVFLYSYFISVNNK